MKQAIAMPRGIQSRCKFYDVAFKITNCSIFMRWRYEMSVGLKLIEGSNLLKDHVG